jgi:hypothetical protein
MPGNAVVGTFAGTQRPQRHLPIAQTRMQLFWNLSQSLRALQGIFTLSHHRTDMGARSQKQELPSWKSAFLRKAQNLLGEGYADGFVNC